MKYIRANLPVEAILYEPEKGQEDGFELLSKVITNGWVSTDSLIRIKDTDGKIKCPFITNKRGRIFIGEGDYIIMEEDGERHVCGKEKFSKRFKELS